MDDFNWDRTNPFIIDAAVRSDRIDGYGHVSNHFYISCPLVIRAGQGAWEVVAG